MAASERDVMIWRRAADLLQQAERIHRNFLQLATAVQYRAPQGRLTSWSPPVNVVETEESLWVMAALPGVAAERVDIRLEGCELRIAGERPLPKCCRDGELKVWEVPLGRFERRLSLVRHQNPLKMGEIVFQNGLLIVELKK
ncbi:MAG TPA: Hsp20/alpha crystallin family protein [candidate division Zixibacteria bacterium]|nr:Hsp20/alpha crystallin family protein [candidate division Zixibacteria bacterium]